MNGYTLAGSFNGALGECPISQILNTDLNTNTVIASPNETLFSNKGSNNTKLDNTGTLRIYHNQTVTLPTVSSQWISVVDALVYLLQADIMWNTQSLDDSAHFLLIDQEITGLTQALAATNQVVNTVSGVATGAAGTTALNTQSINTINNTTIPNLSNTYLKLSGGTLTGGLTGTTINLSGSLTTNSIIYNTQELSTSLNYYLLKSGGTLSGPITLNTRLYADPGPYPQGYNGDRIVIIGTNGYPYIQLVLIQMYFGFVLHLLQVLNLIQGLQLH